jgi:hypothetical protein
MWRWIADYYRPGDDVKELKVQWLKLHGIEGIRLDCFFCAASGGDCRNCPARKVDSHFHCALVESYNWEDYPKKFYKKITRLHKIWLKK